jgi:uncharacterized protein
LVIVDANVLVYAVNQSMPQHSGAKTWLEEALNSQESVGFAWVVLLAFLRISTLPALFPEPLASADALDVIGDWLDARPAVVVQPTHRHASALRSLLVEVGTAGNLVTDAHLAALSLEHGARICSFDRDFHRFPGVRVFSPA